MLLAFFRCFECVARLKNVIQLDALSQISIFMHGAELECYCSHVAILRNLYVLGCLFMYVLSWAM